jgi:serine/threonine-protein kinase RsbW
LAIKKRSGAKFIASYYNLVAPEKRAILHGRSRIGGREGRRCGRRSFQKPGEETPVYSVKTGIIMLNAEIPTGIESKNLVLSVFMDKLREFVESDPFDEYGCRLAMDEALTNAMEHGNNWNPGAPVRILAVFNYNYISITIEDAGDGFDTDIVFTGRPAHPLRPRGHGIPLIKQYSKAFWNQKGNSITLRFDLGVKTDCCS